MRFITVAIHTYEKALALRSLLESEGIDVELNNVNLEVPGFSSGVRVRIREHDLPLALRIIENKELFLQPTGDDAHRHNYLVPVDFSEHSFKAALVTARIAKREEASMTLLYSYLDPYIAGNVQFSNSLTYEIGETGAREALVQNARRLMENFAERLRGAMKRGEVPVVPFTQKVVEGVPEDAIVDYAKMASPHLIVMGTRSAARKERDMIGSVTAEVLDEGRFTVLTVPEPLTAETSIHPLGILFFSNLDQDDILALDALYRLYPGNIKVELAYFPQRKRMADAAAAKAMERLCEYCRANFTDYTFSVRNPVRLSSDTDFENIRASGNFDLVVIPNRRRNAFSRLFNPGLSHNILFRTDIPMLVIPV